MRTARIKAQKHQERAYYHCISRVVERRFALGEAEKEKFVKLMRGYEDFCGVKLVTFCIMSNHFHPLVEVPRQIRRIRRIRQIGRIGRIAFAPFWASLRGTWCPTARPLAISETPSLRAKA